MTERTGMTLGELIDRVTVITGLEGRPAFDVAYGLLDDDGEVPEGTNADAIAAKARELGHDVPEPEKPKQESVEPEMTMDPGQVLVEVYEACPRVLTHQMPRIGRAPKESVFHNDEMDEMMRAQIESLPEEIRLLIGDVDLFKGELMLTLYDEANDVDRRIGPINLERYATGEQLHEAINVLLKRIGRVLAADFN